MDLGIAGKTAGEVFDFMEDTSGYKLPSVNLLDEPEGTDSATNTEN